MICVFTAFALRCEVARIERVLDYGDVLRRTTTSLNAAIAIVSSPSYVHPHPHKQEASKESHVKNGELIGIDGVNVKTAELLAFAGLYDLPKLDVKTLVNTKKVICNLVNGDQSKCGEVQMQSAEK